MTLVLTVVASRFVVQVSDRLTTVSGTEHDPRANKSIVFRSRDGVSAISYSGLAYFNKTPTDEWVASKLIGASLGSRGFGGAPWLRVPDIGLSLIQLSDALAAYYKRLPGSHCAFWYTAAAGWQGSRRAQRAIAYELTNRTRSGRTVFRWAPVTPRPTMPSGKFALLQSPYVLTADDERALRERLRDGAPDNPENAEEALVATIQGVASRSPVVGADCMSIVASPSISPGVRCRFIPARVEHATPGAGGFTGKPQAFGPSGAPTVPEGAPVGYSPLIIAPGAVHFPSVMVGSFVANLGGLSIALEGPRSQAQRFFLGTHSRKPPS